MYKILPSKPEATRKKFTIKLPGLEGKFGLSLNFGNKEVFIGVAIAKTSMETVVRKRRQQAFSPQGKLKVIDL